MDTDTAVPQGWFLDPDTSIYRDGESYETSNSIVFSKPAVDGQPQFGSVWIRQYRERNGYAVEWRAAVPFFTNPEMFQTLSDAIAAHPDYQSARAHTHP